MDQKVEPKAQIATATSYEITVTVNQTHDYF